MLVRYIGTFYKTKHIVLRDCYKQIIFSRSKTTTPSTSTLTDQVKQPSYFHHVGAHPLVYRTVGEVLSDTAGECPDRECLVSMHENQRYTFAEMNNKANQIASGFISSGLKKGDRIGIWAPNYACWYLTMMAAAKAGLILVAINPGYQKSEIEYCINKVEMKAIVTLNTFKSQKYYKMLAELAPELERSAPGSLQSSRIPSLTTVVIDSDETFAGAYKFNDISSLATDASNKQLTQQKESVQADDPFNIQFTSGTTGSPKAVVLSHYSLVNNSLNSARRFELAKKHEKLCLQLPMFHVYGTGTLISSLYDKNTVILEAASFKAIDSLKAIQEEKCTVLFGAPTMFVDLVAKQKEHDYKIDSMEVAISGGAACSPHLFKQMKETLNLKTVKQGYGMTETSSAVFSSLPNESEDRTLNYVGHVQDHTEVKVIDKEGNIVPMGTPGELCVRFYGLMQNYWGDEEKTAEVIGPDNWFKTGDKFILEPSGYGQIVGRIKEMIIRGGENIYPMEIEDFLNTHPDILEAHVFGVSDARMGEEVCVFVRIREGAKFNQDILKSFCKGKIAHFKIPSYLEVVDSFPKTLSGKVQKFKLREIVENKLAKSR